jgi:hypothetical protein
MMAEGYTSTSNRPFALPVGTEDYSSVFVVKKNRPAVSKTRNTYDLGLGKNQPVQGKTQTPTGHVTSFLLEHESVRQYPSPLDEQAIQEPSINKRKKILPKVNLKRRSEDVFRIESGEFNAAPLIIATSSGDKFDVNTVWVEMMIHSEQMKLVPAN